MHVLTSPHRMTGRVLSHTGRVRTHAPVRALEAVEVVEEARHAQRVQRDVREIKTSTGKITSRGKRIEDYEVSETPPDSVLPAQADLLPDETDTKAADKTV